MHFRAIDFYLKLELFAYGLDVLESFLVVGTGTAHPDLHLVLVQRAGNRSERADDALKGGCDLLQFSKV